MNSGLIISDMLNIPIADNISRPSKYVDRVGWGNH